MKMKMRTAHKNVAVKLEMKIQLETWAFIEVNDMKDPTLTECQSRCKCFRMGDRTIYGALTPEMTSFQNGIDG
jgi:hypothetical protein